MSAILEASHVSGKLTASKQLHRRAHSSIVEKGDPKDEVPALQWLKSFLPRSQSKSVFLFAMLCYTLTLTTTEAILIRVARLWPIVSDPIHHVPRPVRPGIDAAKVVDTLLLAPILESLVIVGIIEGLRKMGAKPTIQVLAAAIAICSLHSFQYRFFAFLVAPGFLIAAATYVYWRPKSSLWVAGLMIIILHAAYNTIEFLTVLPIR